MLHRLSSSSILDPGEGERMETIRSKSRELDISQCTPCPKEPLSGTTNPADLPSRGLTMVELSVSHLWRTGPDWLSTEVPLSSDVEPSAMPEHCSQEQSSSSKLSHNLVTVEGPTIGALLECGNYSSWTRIVRVSAYVLRAVAQFKARKRSVSPGAMTVQEVTAAKLLWLLHAQGALAQHKDFDSLRYQLGLFLNNKGVWRCGGRLKNLELPYSIKYTILLPHGHPVSALIYAHRYVCHNGVKETLKEVCRR